MPGELIIGLMSGTSVDGIDAALVEFESATELRVLETQFTPFEEDLQRRVNRLAQSPGVPQACDYAGLDAELAQLYAAASLSLMAKSGVERSLIAAIANHGQTIAHEPPCSLQIGDAQTIANLTGLTTISQFRQADLAAGGQGAPLMPAFHQAVFGNSRSAETKAARVGNAGTARLILNLGGIANVTALGDSVIGFDTGPANTLLNQWINHCRQQAYDAGGQWAASGVVIAEVLDQLLSDPYFAMPYPKSTGPDYFNLAWLHTIVPQLARYPAADLQATLLELSVETIAIGIQQLISKGVISKEVVSKNSGATVLAKRKAKLNVCGGGVHNRTLMGRLADRLDRFEVRSTDALGVPADWVEATGFAWLGYCQLHGIPSNLPSVTGASKQVVLGERFKPHETS